MDGNISESLPNKALVLLFSAQRTNSFRAAEGRRPGGSSSSFQVAENRGIILLQGRKYHEGPDTNPSILRMDAHVVLPEVQRAAYSVPLLTPTSALGRSTAEEVHDMCYGESASSTNARASIYWYYIPRNLPYFKHLADSCYKCRKILQRRGRDVIAPLRSLGVDTLLEGNSLMVNCCGRLTLLCKPRGVSTTREAARTGRDRIKLYMLLSHRILMHTDSLTSALHQIMMEHGWHTHDLAFDAGSSLVPAIENTVDELRHTA